VTFLPDPPHRKIWRIGGVVTAQSDIPVLRLGTGASLGLAGAAVFGSAFLWDFLSG